MRRRFLRGSGRFWQGIRIERGECECGRGPVRGDPGFGDRGHCREAGAEEELGRVILLANLERAADAFTLWFIADCFCRLGYFRDRCGCAESDAFDDAGRS